MFNYLKVLFLILFSSLLIGCGEEDVSQEKVAAPAISASTTEVVEEITIDVMYLPSQVVYQEEIYKNWPYTAAPAEKAVSTEADSEAAVSVEPVVNANPQTHTINAQARVFKPDTIYINVGDSVAWRNMNSHNTVSVEGLIPEGAKSWASKLGENLKVTLDVEGVYAFVCQPHIGFGMVGIIVVGKPSNIEEIKAFARDNLKGPFRRIIGKLNKVKVP
jgi:pseudoazurin